MSKYENKLLIVFDLNNVLIGRKSMTNNYQFRPYVREFLVHISKMYLIAMWTSAKKKSVIDIIQLLFHSNGIQLEFIWFQEKCYMVNNHTNGESKPLFIKQLSLIWETYKQFNINNTVSNATIYVFS